MIFFLFLTFSDLVAQRGERLELLIDKTENLVDSVSMEYDSIVEILWLMAKIIGKCLKIDTLVEFFFLSNPRYVTTL